MEKDKEKKKKIALCLPESVYLQARVRAFLGPMHYSTFNAYLRSLILKDIGEARDNK